jgi:hypothetical protein
VDGRDWGHPSGILEWCGGAMEVVQPVRGIPGLLPGQLVEILKGVFGPSTPKLWWLKLLSDLLALEIVFAGQEYRISPEEIGITQTGYVESRLGKINIPGHLRNEDQATAELVEQNRMAIGCLSWLAKQYRADLQFQVAQAQRVQGNPSVADVKETNKIVDAAKNHKYEGIKVKWIPEDRMVFLAYHDAAWANADLEGEPDQHWDGDFKKASQLASLVLVADKCVVENQAGRASLIDWRSKASAEICRSTIVGETMACGYALETCLYLRSLMLSFIHGRLIHEKDAGKYVNIHLCTDCKSLYDHLHKAGTPKPPAERRLALDLAVIRQSLQVEAKHQWKKVYGDGQVRPDKPCEPSLHWVPADKELADILTKRMRADAWWATLSSGLLVFIFYCVKRTDTGILISYQCECNFMCCLTGATLACLKHVQRTWP